MLKKMFFSKQGFTIIELLIVIAVTMIVTVTAAVYIRTEVDDDVDTATTQLLSDFRFTRGLAVSRTAFDFDGLGLQPAVYPPGGYGISFQDNTYTIFAESGDNIGFQTLEDGTVRAVTLENTALKLLDNNDTTSDAKYFTFKSENEAITDINVTAQGTYELAVDYNTGLGGVGYKSVLTLGQTVEGGKIFPSLGQGISLDYQPTCAARSEQCGGSLGCCIATDLCQGAPSVCVKPPPTNNNTSCFPAGTKISMADGAYKNIEDVKIGDFVLSYDEEAGTEVNSEVLELVAPIRDHMCELIFDDSDIKLTIEHPVYTIDGWKAIDPFETARENDDLIVERLMLGDEVFFEGVQYKEVREINCWQEDIQTYNLKSVKDSNTFFADGVLVHNLVGPGCDLNNLNDPANVGI